MKNIMKDEAGMKLPISDKGVEAFLAGDMVEGIGPVYAKRLVETYGNEVVEKLRDEPESITEISGLGAARLKTASDSLLALTQPLDIVQFLYSCGIQELFIPRILGKYRKRNRWVIEEDPFQMV